MDNLTGTVLRALLVFVIAVTVPVGVVLILYYFKRYPSSFLLFLGMYYVINAPRLLLDFAYWVSDFSTDIETFYGYFALFQRRLQIFLMFILSLNQFFLTFFSQKFDYSFWNYFGLLSSIGLNLNYSMMDFVLSKKTKDIPEILDFVSLGISAITLLKVVFHHPPNSQGSEREERKLCFVIFVLTLLSSLRVVLVKCFPAISHLDEIFEVLALSGSTIILLAIW